MTGGAPAPAWDALPEPWRVCLEELWAAYRAGSVPHGAAVTDATGRVLTRGRNRALEAADGIGRLAGSACARYADDGVEETALL